MKSKKTILKAELNTLRYRSEEMDYIFTMDKARYATLQDEHQALKARIQAIYNELDNLKVSE